MSVTDKRFSRILSQVLLLAERLELDIKNRNLKPGEQFYTAMEASRFLGVSGATANRALQVLEKRQIISRSQRRGAIILAPPDTHNCQIDNVHFLIHDKYYRREGIGGDGILLGIQSELPTATVSHCFLTPENESQQIAKLIDRSFSENSRDAFIIVRSSYEAQKMIAESGLPALIYGSTYPGISGLSNIDRDHKEAVRLVVRYLQSRGRTCLAAFFSQNVLPGLHQVLDALHHTRSLLMTMRFMPQEDECIEAEALNILTSPKSPEAILCHTMQYARCIDRVRKKLNRSELDIVLTSSYLKRGETTHFPHIELSMDPEAIGRHLASSLLRHVGGQEVHGIVPVKLVLPESP